MSLFAFPKRRAHVELDGTLPGAEPSPWDDWYDGVQHPLYTLVGTSVVYDYGRQIPGRLIANVAASRSAFEALIAPVPTGDFMAALRVESINGYPTSIATAAYVGLAASTVATAGAGTQLIAAFGTTSNVYKLFMQKWTNWTTFSTNYLSDGTWDDVDASWVTLRREGTTWYVGATHDLRAVSGEISVTEATLGATPAHIGPVFHNPLGRAIAFTVGPLIIRHGPGSASDQQSGILSTPWRQAGQLRYSFDQPL